MARIISIVSIFFCVMMTASALPCNTKSQRPPVQVDPVQPVQVDPIQPVQVDPEYPVQTIPIHPNPVQDLPDTTGNHVGGSLINANTGHIGTKDVTTGHIGSGLVNTGNIRIKDTLSKLNLQDGLL